VRANGRNEGAGRALRRCLLSPALPSAIVAVCARSSGVPVTLREIATVASMDEKDVARVLLVLRRMLHHSGQECTTSQSLDQSESVRHSVSPAVYLSRCIRFLCKEEPVSKVREALGMAGFWMEECHNAWITDGRKPAGITISCVTMTVLALGIRSDENVVLDELRNLLMVGRHTVRDRFKELRELLIEKCKTFLPYSNAITEKELPRHLKNLWAIMKLSRMSKDGSSRDNSALPPRLKQKNREWEIRKQKVESARRRIGGAIGKNPVASDNEDPEFLDDEDAEIESLLLLGVPEDTIVFTLSLGNAAEQTFAASYENEAEGLENSDSEPAANHGS